MFDLIHEFVIDSDGNTYELEAIVRWILANGDSPVTRSPLTVEELYYNNALLETLWEEQEGEEGHEIHSSIRRWKDEVLQRRRLQQDASPTPSPEAKQAPGAPLPLFSVAQRAEQIASATANLETHGHPRSHEEVQFLHEYVSVSHRNRSRCAWACLFLVVVVNAIGVYVEPNVFLVEAKSAL